MLPTQEKSPMSIDALQETAINVVELFCGIICRPVELILRPWHGTRYFQPTVIFCSTMLMIFIPAFSAAVTGIGSMIPFTRFVPPPGMFGMGSFATLYFALSFLHGIRIYRRMVHMELEEHSEYEGGPLPFIRQMEPVSAELTGSLENGAITFHVDKVIGIPWDGCTLTSYSITSFGSQQIAAQWQEGSCPGGQLILVRAQR
jgi:hypothetical protein